LGEPDLAILIRNGEIRFSHASVRKLGFKSSSLYPLERPPSRRNRKTGRV
jgi:hypothetical protein